MVRRIFVWVLAAASIGLVALAAQSASAKPTVQSTTCDISLLLSFRPGLTFDNSRHQDIRGKGNASNCVGGGVTSANIVKGVGSGNMGCTGGSGTATLNIAWNTTEKSRVSVTVDASGNIVGTVILGKFVGEDVTASLSVTPLNGDCFFTPVTKASAVGSGSL
jgi:hypothetical protein